MKKIKKKKAFVINFSFSKLEYIFSKLIIYIINIKHRKCPLSQTMKNKYYYYLNLCLSRLILFWVIWAQIEVIKYCVFLGKFVFISEIKKTLFYCTTTSDNILGYLSAADKNISNSHIDFCSCSNFYNNNIYFSNSSITVIVIDSMNRMSKEFYLCLHYLP